MFSDELQRYKESGKLVEVYMDEHDTSKFDVGFILAHDDDFFLMLAVTKYGRLDGYLLQEVDAIVRVSSDTAYLKRIATLMRYYNEKQERLTAGDSLAYDVLEYCRINNRIASIDILGSGYADALGYVEELDGERCIVRQVTEDGKSDGTTSILLNDISYISCCSNIEVMLEILNSELFDEMHSS